ncbi:stage II sporulation protein M [Cellulomonas bogoriensis]|uniref:Membrane protein n=1 Tax=Cellulomonas bogoriensis 69B4 = DSM 16987 TaxID=1386082 RepID=A0A0A0BZE4_9CELL|nr:stage II sporulation protein M [Cellulomonas bogoriensis]KGM13082.1 membrane protein [Cellulomonas bogoriensis 69B4 = DSM 16987]
MDLDAFSAVHAPTWARLDELARRRRLTGAESDELVRLYQTTATHLSTVRSSAPDPAAVAHLSDVLSRARARIAGAHEPSWRDVARFVVVTVPVAFYRVRWWTVAVMVAFCLLAVVSGVHVYQSPEAQAAIGPPSQLQQYAEQEFANYYTNHPGESFAAQVWTNNAWIAAQSVALGISGVWPVYVLVQNAVNVGAAGGIMALHDGLGIFFQLILPHGLLELTAIFVAGGAGLKIFWTLVSPGGRPRGRAVAEEGRSLFVVALGLVGVLALAGLIEGFVTPSEMPWWLKIVIGAIALAGYWVYTLVLGGRAAAAGETGDLRADHNVDAVPLAA